MNASLTPLKDPVSTFIEHNPFSQFFHQDRGALSKSRGVSPSPVPEKPDPKALSMSYYRKTSLSFSLSATYTRVGTLTGNELKARDNCSPMPLGLDMGKLKNIFSDIMHAFQKGNDPQDMEKEDIDPDGLLKKLIVEKLFGRSSDGPGPRVDEVKYYEEKYKRLDFSIDYSGLVKWKGSVFQTEFHMELHLEQKEISYIDYQGTSDGLTRLDDKNVDTGRYLVSFENSTSLTIFDKFSKLSTTIWGDPHVDLSDKEGRCNGEFNDLKKSTMLTSLRLLDNTTVVIKAPDNGLIQEVHVFKDGDHIKGLGKGAFIKKRGEAPKDGHKVAHPGNKPEKCRAQCLEGTFGQIDHVSDLLEDFLTSSDVVTAGGDGNDWFDENGELVWGG